MALADTTILQAIGALWNSRWYRDSETWSAWFAFLRVLFNLPLSDADHRIYTECTAREELPDEAIREGWLICGRRAGKSFVLATIAVYLAIFRDWSRYVVPGERPTIKVIAVNREQAHVIYHYIRALLIEAPTPRGTRSVDGQGHDRIDDRGCDPGGNDVLSWHSRVRGLRSTLRRDCVLAFGRIRES
jgi:hypothetical protein